MPYRKTILILILTALVLAVVFGITSKLSARASQEITQPNAAPLSSSSTGLKVPVNTIEVLGTFVAPNQTTLAFRSSGRIADINVQEGAQVKSGDVLAQLDSTSLDLGVKQAQATLTLAQDRFAQLKNGPSEADLTAAKAAVDAAKQNYDKLRAGATTSDLAAAQAALAAAQQNYAKVKAGPTADDLAQLKAQVDNAKAALDQAQAAYDRIGGATNPFIAQTPQAKALQQATNNYNAALAAYNSAHAHPTAAELAAAIAQVQQAQAAFARLTPDTAALASAASQLEQAQSALARLQPTADNLKIAQDQIDQAQAALAFTQQQVTDATLVAPEDGTVIWLGPHVGESVALTSPVLTLADVSHLQLQAGVDESTLAQIQVGQAVMIVPEAFKDKKINGKVARIGWLATTTAGVINVPVTIDVDANDIALRPGLSAIAEIQK